MFRLVLTMVGLLTADRIIERERKEQSFKEEWLSSWLKLAIGLPALFVVGVLMLMVYMFVSAPLFNATFYATPEIKDACAMDAAIERYGNRYKTMPVPPRTTRDGTVIDYSDCPPRAGWGVMLFIWIVGAPVIVISMVVSFFFTGGRRFMARRF
jgi:hypothetical protein